MTAADKIQAARSLIEPLLPIKITWKLTEQPVNVLQLRDIVAALADLAEALEQENDKLLAENERLHEALTPSGETKYAYIGEFSWTEWEADADDIEQGYERKVPWTTIKEIMAAIRARAALGDTP